VRLAKSSSDMWTPIFLHNAENVIPVLDTYISRLLDFRKAMENSNAEHLQELIRDANKIKRVLTR
jgi:prephenate dehydrogenase